MYAASETLELAVPRRTASIVHRPLPRLPSDFEEGGAQPQKTRAKPTTKTNNTTDRERTYVESTAGDRPAQTKTTKSRTSKAKPVVEMPPVEKRSPQKTASTLRPSFSHEDHHSAEQPRTKLIRRVHAVIDVPVKDEQYSDNDALASEGSAFEQMQQQVSRRPRRKSSKNVKSYVESDDSSFKDSDVDDTDQLLIGAEVRGVTVLPGRDTEDTALRRIPTRSMAHRE